MSRHYLVWAGAVALVASASLVPHAQIEFTNNFKFNVGQSVQPIFEGWSHAEGGGYHFHFGYLNRNYVEQPHVPVGPDNNIMPGGPDRGQPTFFYNRTNRNVFTVKVPQEWGPKEELVWTLTHNGQSLKAHGWLQTEWEIDPVGGAQQGGNTDPERVANKPPALTIGPVAPLKMPAVVTLSTTVTDDGLPKPRPRGKPPVGQETPPTLQGGVQAPVNVPQVSTRETPPGATPPPGATRPQGLSVTWIVWRGPAEVAFEPRYVEPKDGKTETTASFQAPGEYVLRAAAYDGLATTYDNVTVTVTGTPASQP